MKLKNYVEGKLSKKRNQKKVKVGSLKVTSQRRPKKSWVSITIPSQAKLRYLEAVLDVVARLPDAHRLQHAGVAQLPQHQVVAEPQGQLGDVECRETRRAVVGDGWTTPDLRTLRAT